MRRLPSPSNSTALSVSLRRRHPDGERDAVADRAELADGVVVLGLSAAHGRMEIGLVAGAADAVVVLGDDAVELVDHAAGIEQPRLDGELRAIGGLVDALGGEGLGQRLVDRHVAHCRN
jgi:hypothetical protein